MSENVIAAPTTTNLKRESATAKKRIILNRRVVLDDGSVKHKPTTTIRTSTPKQQLGGNNMDINFAHHFSETKKLDIITTLDQDSGYISYNHESNSEYSVENDNNTIKMSRNRSDASGPVFISEDALLEKPEISPKNVQLINSHSNKSAFNTPASNSDNNNSECSDTSSISVVSHPPAYEGLENSPDTSDMSIEIPVIDPIIVINNALSNKMEVSSNEPLNNSISSGMIGLSLTTDFTCFVQQNPSSVTSETNSSTSAAAVPKNREKNRLNLIISKANKENLYKVRRKYATPDKSVSATKPLNPNVSPDLFDDDVVYRPPPKVENNPVVDVLLTQIVPEKYVDKKDERLLKRLQASLGGVLPPPSVTVLHLSAEDILNKIEANKEYLWNNLDGKVNNSSLNCSSESCDGPKSLLRNVEAYSEVSNDDKQFPEVLKIRDHGINYNSSKLTEQIDELYEKFAKRFIGAETQSSFTVFNTNFGSPSKRRSQKQQKFGTKSPGRRLSHLARRRITFSSASLQVGGSSLAGSRARQILVDARKIGGMRKKSPRKTPNKSPRLKSRTPTSSAKKKLAMRFKKITGELQNSNAACSAKKALFTSPDNKSFQGSARKSLFKSPEFENKHLSSSLFLPGTSASQSLRSNPRRALFVSPIKNVSPSKRVKSPYKRALGLSGSDTKKRKRSESEDVQQSFDKSKIAKIDNRPTSSENNDKMLMNRLRNDSGVFNRSTSHIELSDLHKKKLQWAVYEALKQQNIKPSHAEFKNFASTLARVTRRFLPNLSGTARPEDGCGTSQRMLRIARQHVYNVVVKGKSVDEIMNDYLQQRSKVVKPQGYIPIDNNSSNSVTNNKSGFKENVLQDRVNTMESWEKRKLEQLGNPKSESKIDRIRKVINFGDDHR